MNANRRMLFKSAAAFAAVGAAHAKMQPVSLEDRKFEPIKLPRPISLAALTVIDVSPANQVL